MTKATRVEEFEACVARKDYVGAAAARENVVTLDLMPRNEGGAARLADDAHAHRVILLRLQCRVLVAIKARHVPPTFLVMFDHPCQRAIVLRHALQALDRSDRSVWQHSIATWHRERLAILCLHTVHPARLPRHKHRATSSVPRHR